MGVSGWPCDCRGEQSGRCAAEVREEIGVNLDPAKGRVVLSQIREKMNGKALQDILDVWLFDYEGEPHLDLAECNESCACRWMSVEQIRRLYDQDQFVKALDYFWLLDLGHGNGQMVFDDSIRINAWVSGWVDLTDSGRLNEKIEVTASTSSYAPVKAVRGWILSSDQIQTADKEEKSVADSERISSFKKERAYVLGLKPGQQQFEGRILAGCHQLDDGKTIWIVSVDDHRYSPEEIAATIAFDQQHFYSILSF